MSTPTPPPAPDGIRVNRHITIPEHELTWRYSASGGPGGQHANTANTRVELVFDMEASTSLPETARARLLDHLGPLIRIVVTDERSQLRNRDIARERLRARLAAALVVQRTRRASKPSRGAVERRLTSKARRSSIKSDRRRPDDD